MKTLVLTMLLLMSGSHSARHLHHQRDQPVRLWRQRGLDGLARR